MALKSSIKTIDIFLRPDNKKALIWEKKLRDFIERQWNKIRFQSRNPDLVIALGGDGTILQAAKQYRNGKTIILGLNLGNVGFLASARNEREFIKTVSDVLSGGYRPVRRMTLEATVSRNGHTLYDAVALNEIAIENILGMVSLDVAVDGHAIQHIQGTGVLVSTPTGSTAWNLSSHGPVVMPDLECSIITELGDHNIPTPSIIVHPENIITLHIRGFRSRNLLTLPGGTESVDVVIAADGERIFALHEGDVVTIKRSTKPAIFAEIEPNYFFKSLKERIDFK